MVLKILTAASSYFPSEYTVHIVATLITILATRRIAQGRWTTRERDMHARVVVVTGGFTPLGLTLLESLAHRGAHIIALTPHPASSPPPRPPSTRSQRASSRATTPTPPPPRRISMLLGVGMNIGALPQFAPGGAKGRAGREREQRARDKAALASFLLMTLLVAGDAHGAGGARYPDHARCESVLRRGGTEVFRGCTISSPTSQSQLRDSPLLAEASRTLPTVLLTRHLQRVLDALPSTPVPNPSDGTSTATGRVASQKSNIVAMSVSSGLSRTETVAPLFGYREDREGRSWWGSLFYILLYPLLFLLTKSASATLQSVLHVLFLPTPVKIAKSEKPKTKPDANANANAEPEEALKLCAMPDDGELGGEAGGRAVRKLETHLVIVGPLAELFAESEADCGSSGFAAAIESQKASIDCPAGARVHRCGLKNLVRLGDMPIPSCNLSPVVVFLSPDSGLTLAFCRHTVPEAEDFGPRQQTKNQVPARIREIIEKYNVLYTYVPQYIGSRLRRGTRGARRALV
ncbi:hypothetical protein DFH06DRAFT_1135946 [Mycena polygramma]|nr:hypothetical protein DFH06DRAFT_1135946 [Mycena polygramma]